MGHMRPVLNESQTRLHPQPQIPPQALPMWTQRVIDSDIMSQRNRYTTKHRSVYRHVAMIFKGRKLIAVGQNRICRRGPYSMMHAECDALRSACVSQLRDAILVVIRIGPQGLLSSEPCSCCYMVIQKYMKEYGLRGCIHS